MSKILIVAIGLACAMLLVVFLTTSETSMAPPKTPNDPEQDAGTPTPGDSVEPDAQDTPEQSDRLDGEAEIGMPMTPEELRRLKEEADKPDPEN